MIRTEQELEELMSRPTEGDKAALASMDGQTLAILGVGGKMGPSLARRARRAAVESGAKVRVVAISRFSEQGLREGLEAEGIETVACDLLADDLGPLPEAASVIFMAGRKFGSTGNESLTWAMNALAPARVAERYQRARIVAFSSGNIYPLLPPGSGGAVEDTPFHPIGEYAQSVMARERVFEYYSKLYGTPAVMLRLNYAIDLRYGVLRDIALKVFERRPVDVTMGAVNVIWQGDANSVALRALEIAAAPPVALNLTGPETLSVRALAARFGRIFGIEPEFTGAEAPTALLNNASYCHRLFGYPSVGIEQMVEWTAEWISAGGRSLNKPTHFEARDGKF